MSRCNSKFLANVYNYFGMSYALVCYTSPIYVVLWSTWLMQCCILVTCDQYLYLLVYLTNISSILANLWLNRFSFMTNLSTEIFTSHYIWRQVRKAKKMSDLLCLKIKVNLLITNCGPKFDALQWHFWDVTFNCFDTNLEKVQTHLTE